MNLTYDDDDKVYNTSKCCDAHLNIARTYAEAKNIATDRNRLGELGSIFSKLVAFKDKLTPSFIKSNKLAVNLIDPADSLLYHSEKNLVIPAAGKYGNIIAPVASFFGPWGKLVAVGVTLARQDYVQTQQAAKDLQATRANASQLLDQYNKMAGTVPGRVIGTDTLKDILRAQVVAQKWPPITEDSEPKSPAVRTFFDNINKAAQQGIARGAVSAYDVYKTEWPDTFQADKNQQWMVPNDQYEAQLTLDALDDAMAKLNPSLPFSYGTTDAAAADPSAQVQATATWYVAANENNTVPFTGTRQVRYGANGKFITKTMTSNGAGVVCNNSTFGGDPIVGTVKACYLLSSEDTPNATKATTPAATTQSIQPVSSSFVDSSTQGTWYAAANENNMVPFTGTRQVRYGANGKFVTKTMTASGGGVKCSNDTFGGDPNVGTPKVCYLLSSEDTPAVTPAPVATVNNTVPLSTDQQTMMQTLLNQLAAQGASQQQMNSALISALSSTGVDTSAPAVQQAVATDVAATHAATASGTPIPVTAGTSVSGWLGWVLAGIGVIFALGVPRGTSRRKRSKRSRR